MRLEQLLETEWSACYRLALALVHEPSAAEDVTQEALLAAYEARESFDASRPVRPWLFGIVHRRALKHHRGGKRRAAREERVARPERTDDATGAVADAEQAALVRDHLGRIDADYRNALALRYVEGLSLAEVGEALGLPLGTVSSRIRRGLRDLERSLSPALSVGGAALLELLQRALRDVAVPPAPTAEALLRRPPAVPPMPVAPRRRWARAAAVVTVALLATAAVALVVQPEPVTRVAPPAGPAPVAAGTSQAGVRSATGTDGVPPAVAPVETSAGGDRQVAVRGRARSRVALERAWVRPIDGAELARLLGPSFLSSDVDAARRLLGRERFGWNVPEGSRPLGPDGAFALDLPAGTTLLAVGAHGCRTRLLPLDGSPLDVELAWLQPSTLALTAVDQAGLPFGGHWLRLSGAASLGADPWVDGADAWAAGQPEGARLLRELRAAPLQCAPLDANGAATLALPSGDWALEAELWSANRTPSSTPPFLSSSLGGAPCAASLPPGGTADARLVFDWEAAADEGCRARLDVEVVDDAGQPVVGAWVQVTDRVSERRVDDLRSAGDGHVTDARGRIRLFGLPEAKDFAVAARAGERWTGLERRVRTGGAWSAGEQVPLVQLALDRPWVTGALRLVLRDAATGAPPSATGVVSVGVGTIGLADAWDVGLVALAGQPEAGRSGWRAEAEGALVIEELPPGRWELLVLQPEAPREVSWLPGRVEAEVTAGETREVTLALTQGATLHGRVTVSGQPLPSQGTGDVSVYDPERERVVCSASVDAEGRFAVSSLVAGRAYALLVRARPGLLSSVFRDVKPGPTEQPFAVPDGPALTVVVKDELGAPLRGARVRWSRSAEDGEGTTDAQGQVTFRGELRHPLAVRAWLEGHAPQELTATPPGPVALGVVLGPAPGSALLRARVVDPSGVPLRGVAVGTGLGLRGETDAEGRIALRVEAEDEVRLFLDLPGHLGGGRRLTLPANGEELTLTLAPGATLEGRVAAPAERLPRLRLLIALAASPGKRDRLPLDAQGVFRVGRAIPPDRYRLEVVDRDSGATLVTREVELVAGQTVRDVVLSVE